MASHGTTSSPDAPVTFVGRRAALFWLALKTGFFTVLTLGLYRFWAKTRLRRWYWSATRPGGFPLEYVGTAWEKLVGFLMAVVILAFYLGVVNLILMFGSLTLFADQFAAYALSFVGIIPLWFYAHYRARRYVLARTRWRTIRFGLMPGAWGYVWRACLHWFLTVVTVGIWEPRRRFALIKYKTDRTFLGDHRLEQGGKRTMLYPAFVHLMIGGFITAMAPLVAINEPHFLKIWVLGIPWLIYGWFHYMALGNRLLWSHTTAQGLGLRSAANPKAVLGIALGGNLVRFAILMVYALLATAVLFGILAAVMTQNGTGFDLAEFEDAEHVMTMLNGLNWAALVPLLILYFGLFLLFSALTHAFLIMPTWRHYAQTLTATGQDTVLAISQRPRDEMGEAEGFAEALDVGAAI